jgi:hypothetical protein
MVAGSAACPPGQHAIKLPNALSECAAPDQAFRAQVLLDVGNQKPVITGCRSAPPNSAFVWLIGIAAAGRDGLSVSPAPTAPPTRATPGSSIARTTKSSTVRIPAIRAPWSAAAIAPAAAASPHLVSQLLPPFIAQASFFNLLCAAHNFSHPKEEELSRDQVGAAISCRMAGLRRGSASPRWS